MTHDELIDKHKILEIAIENVNKGKAFFENTNKLLSGFSIEEKLMLLGFTYVRLLSKTAPIPKDTIRNMLVSINTTVQNLASENKQYKEYSKRQIELVKETETKRVELAHSLKNGNDEKALQLALALIDLYQFGIAKSTIYEDIYSNRSK